MRFVVSFVDPRFLFGSGILAFSMSLGLTGCFSQSNSQSFSSELTQASSLQTSQQLSSSISTHPTNPQLLESQVQLASIIQSDINATLNDSESYTMTEEDFDLLKDQNLMTGEDAQSLSVFLKP